MNYFAFRLSSSAMAFAVGFGVMPQTATKISPFVDQQSMKEKITFFVDQSASSEIEAEIIIMRLIGEYNYRRILDISHFGEGWDGYNAPPIPAKVISRTKGLLVMLPDGARVFPTGRRTIQLEYHKDDDNYLELEVSETSFEIYSLKDNEEFEDSVQEGELVKIVRAFLA